MEDLTYSEYAAGVCCLPGPLQHADIQEFADMVLKNFLIC